MRHATQHNGTQHNDIQHDIAQHEIDIIATLSITALNTGMTSVIMLSVANKPIILCVVMLNVVAPKLTNKSILNGKESTVNRALGGSTYPG